MTDLNIQKQTCRKRAFKQRKIAHENGQNLASRAAGHFLDWLKDRNFNAIAGYMPIGTEIDIRPCLEQLHKRKISLCVPVIIGKNLPLDFHRWTPDCPMEQGPFGAMVPISAALLQPDLLLCPLVAFDMQGNRLGYGGGFYDRSLERLREAGPVLALGYAYSAQQAAQLPSEATDQALDGIITEAGVTIF